MMNRNDFGDPPTQAPAADGHFQSHVKYLNGDWMDCHGLPTSMALQDLFKHMGDLITTQAYGPFDFIVAEEETSHLSRKN